MVDCGSELLEGGPNLVDHTGALHLALLPAPLPHAQRSGAPSPATVSFPGDNVGRATDVQFLEEGRVSYVSEM